MSTGTIERETAHWDTAPQPFSPWEHLAALLPLEDLTQLANERRVLPAVTLASDSEEPLVAPDPYEAAARTLHRTHRGNVLLTGRKGVGKTTFVRELARRAATGEVPFLTGRRFVWIDCRNVGPEDSRACLKSILRPSRPHRASSSAWTAWRRCSSGRTVGRTSRCCGRCWDGAACG